MVMAQTVGAPVCEHGEDVRLSIRRHYIKNKKKQRQVYLTPRRSVASVVPESNVTMAVLMFAEYAHFC